MSRPESRISLLLARLEMLWREHPDIRFGQLIVNLYHEYSQSLYYIEDDETYTLLGKALGMK